MAGTRPTAIAQKPFTMRLMMLLAAMAFLVQGFAVQTHIHGEPVSPAHVAHASAPAQPGPQDPYDPANCPLCQEMLHAGVYVAPMAVDITVILNAVAFAPAYALLPHAVFERPHAWQSRAPPRH
jgi:hypothetical protein